MSRIRIEALLTAVLAAACGGATESSSGSSDGASSSSSSSSGSSGASSSGSSGASGTSSSGVPSCDTSKPPYTETSTYELTQACSDYEARQNSIDAGPDADAADGGAFDCTTLSCSQLCEATATINFGAMHWNGSAADCQKTTTQLSCTFHRPCGRRFAGLEEPKTNDVLAGAAYLEAASVIAFEHLAHDLAFHEAPFPLIAAAMRAAEDERRHTAMVHALAGGPWPEPNATTWRSRALVDIAIENAVEGCVGETWGALVALAQARDARSPDVRTTFSAIASDEIDHAALAHELDAWIRPLLSTEERRAVDDAKQAAWTRFAIDIDPEIARELGIPNGDTSRRMLEALASAA